MTLKYFVPVSASALLLVGCASSNKSGEKKADVPVPTYNEKVGAVTVSDLRPSQNCPADGKWEGPDWRKAVAFANACVKAKDFRKVELIGNYLAIHAHLTPWGAYYMSIAAEARKDIPRAIWMLELALKKAPNEGIFHYQLGRLHWELGDDQLALKELKLASDLNSSLVDAHYVMGQMALNKENYSEAEKLFRKVMANEANHWPTAMGMATLRMKTKDWVKAETALEEAIRMNPRSTKARLALAQVQEIQLKKMQQALSTYKELRSQVQARKTDEPVSIDLESKIKSLEKDILQSAKGNQLSVRKPTSEGQVKQ